ncbi:MAG TPA: hypothetical protein VFN41_08860 [Candidatus Limnocylindrales bacterium]|nr:hypothetical protein [Candidatus Limnocylindrales bacterium]
MPMWRCPHCGTPQAETARCWVCRRSSTSCGTCRHYRRSVAGQLGYCGLDRGRQPLTGEEIRGCWESWAVATGTSVPLTIAAAPLGEDPRPPLEFVEVGAVVTGDPANEADDPAPLAPPTHPATEAGWSLWGDLEP